MANYTVNEFPRIDTEGDGDKNKKDCGDPRRRN